MKSSMSLRERIYREVAAFAVETDYESKIVSFMEDQGIKFEKKYYLFLPDAGAFYVYEIWSAGRITPSSYAVENKLRELRMKDSKR